MMRYGIEGHFPAIRVRPVMTTHEHREIERAILSIRPKKGSTDGRDKGGKPAVAHHDQKWLKITKVSLNKPPTWRSGSDWPPSEKGKRS